MQGIKKKKGSLELHGIEIGIFASNLPVSEICFLTINEDWLKLCINISAASINQ